jgi:hypothetical protein
MRRLYGLQAVATALLLLALLRGLQGALGGLGIGSVFGFLYSLYNNLAGFCKNGLPWGTLFTAIPSTVWDAAKFGAVAGYILIFFIVFSLTFIRTRQFIQILSHTRPRYPSNPQRQTRSK